MLRAVQFILAGIVCCFSFSSFSMGNSPNLITKLFLACSQAPTHPKCNRLGERRINALKFLTQEQKERIKINMCFYIDDVRYIMHQSEPDIFVSESGDEWEWRGFACGWGFPVCGPGPSSCNLLIY